MYKIMVTLLAIMMFITACGTNNSSTNQNATNSGIIAQTSTPQSEQLEKEQEELEIEKQEIVTEKDEVVTEEQEDIWSSLPEYATIIGNIAVEDLSIELVTDNEGTRVLLLSNDANKKQYKTIYVKNTGRLKIISVDGSEDGLIYNDVINK